MPLFDLGNMRNLLRVLIESDFLLVWNAVVHIGVAIIDVLLVLIIFAAAVFAFTEPIVLRVFAFLGNIVTVIIAVVLLIIVVTVINVASIRKVEELTSRFGSPSSVLAN
jgi:hypothetical protein